MTDNTTAWPDYDVEELSVLERMKRIMIQKHGWTRSDFVGMTFADIESEFLDGCGEPDFRPAEEN